MGHGRALPSPFGFDKSFKGDGVGYFIVPKLIGTSKPSQFTVEFWCKPQTNFTGYLGYFHMIDQANNLFIIQSRPGERVFQFFHDPGSLITKQLVLNSWNHIVFCIDCLSGKGFAVVNGDLQNRAITNDLPHYVPSQIANFRFNARETGEPGNEPFDEYRVYNRVISDEEIRLNYNMGIGDNPAATEGLILWHKFEKFENLDFSPLQDNTDIRFGLRDFSGKNNHSLPVNIVTDPSSTDFPLNYF